MACSLLVLVGSAAAQKAKAHEPPPRVDPHTRAEPERLERLGYRSLGPFRFGSETTERVESLLGDEPILWVETEHFRIGSTLEEYTAVEREEIGELQDELRELRTRLDTLPAKPPKKLDPWLRLHLFASRLERLHADFLARLGVLERAPVAPPEGAEQPGSLGMGDKFAILLTQKKSTLARFTREFCGIERPDTHTHYFSRQGLLFFGISSESLALPDAGLHYALVYSATQLLLCGIHGYPHALPPWWQHGVPLWFARAHVPRIQLYTVPGGDSMPGKELADWMPLVRGRVEVGATLAWDEMFAREEWTTSGFGEHIVLWSRIDYLIQEGLATKLVPHLHDRKVRKPDSAFALAFVTEHSLPQLDAAWSEWVLETYTKKRR